MWLALQWWGRQRYLNHISNNCLHSWFDAVIFSPEVGKGLLIPKCARNATKALQRMCHILYMYLWYLCFSVKKFCIVSQVEFSVIHLSTAFICVTNIQLQYCKYVVYIVPCYTTSDSADGSGHPQFVLLNDKSKQYDIQCIYKESLIVYSWVIHIQEEPWSKGKHCTQLSCSSSFCPRSEHNCCWYRKWVVHDLKIWRLFHAKKKVKTGEHWQKASLYCIC